MQVLAVQSDTQWESPEASCRRIEALLARQAIASGALIVLPELFAVGYTMNTEAAVAGSERVGEPFLHELARVHDACLLGGVAHWDEAAGLGRNEALAAAPDGTPLARYCKNRPTTILGEHHHYVAGDEIVTFAWGGLRVAPLICYDLRFGALFREALRAGAEVFAVLANFPGARAHHWRALLQARAIEHQAYVIGVNRCGADPNHEYRGESMILGPDGERLAEAGAEETVLSAELDPQALRDQRARLPIVDELTEGA
jgi:predicted amidohydrolase